MAKSLKDFADEVAEEVGISAPSTIIGNQDTTARSLKQAARRTAAELLSRNDWSVLQKEHTFTLVDGQEAYDLPDDFERVIPYTQWDRNNEWRVLGPFSPQDWQLIKSGLVEKARDDATGSNLTAEH